MKVTIEITEKGWTTEVHINGNVILEKHIATPAGSKSIEGDFENSEDIGNDLYDALNNFANYDVMRALANES